MADEDDDKWPWPEKYVDPFQDVSGPDWVFNACMDQTPDWARYVMAYREGAELLLRPLLESGGADRGHNDLLVYPVVFCWRQFIELILKDMVRMVRALTGKKGTADLHKHVLMPLWNELKGHLPGLGAGQAETEIVESTIARLNYFDPDSFAFRYPENKKGASTQTSIPVRVNLRYLSEAMQNIANWLDAGHTEISERLQFQAEQQAEYEAEMRAEYGGDEGDTY